MLVFDSLHSEISALIAQFLPHDGSLETAIDGLRLYRSSVPTEPVALEYKPGLAFVAQGSKSRFLARNVSSMAKVNHLTDVDWSAGDGAGYGSQC